MSDTPETFEERLRRIGAGLDEAAVRFEEMRKALDSIDVTLFRSAFIEEQSRLRYGGAEHCPETNPVTGDQCTKGVGHDLSEHRDCLMRTWSTAGPRTLDADPEGLVLPEPGRCTASMRGAQCEHPLGHRGTHRWETL